VTAFCRRLAAIAASAARFALAAAFRRRSAAAVAAAELARLGGVLQKAGQLFASRADVLSPATRAELRRLCDRSPPLSHSEAQTVLATVVPRDWVVDLDPIGSGSLAQVHRAVRRDGSGAAVKILRPGARQQLSADLLLLRVVGACVARVPTLRSLPVAAALGELIDGLDDHLDPALEAGRQERARLLFADYAGIVVPRVLDEVQSDVAIAMDLADGVPIDAPGLDPDTRRRALRHALRALYRMIFELGIVHCDLHPGNVLVSPDGAVVLLDFGYAREIAPQVRESFRSFFRALATNDGALAVATIADLQDGRPLPPRFGETIEGLVASMHGQVVEEFQIGRFMLRLLAAHRDHGVRATNDFTAIVLGLIGFEGLLKTFAPELDFQRESLPYVLRVLRAA
jgi:ubiquinone biosynthesis protein